MPTPEEWDKLNKLLKKRVESTSNLEVEGKGRGTSLMRGKHKSELSKYIPPELGGLAQDLSQAVVEVMGEFTVGGNIPPTLNLYVATTVVMSMLFPFKVANHPQWEELARATLRDLRNIYVDAGMAQIWDEVAWE
jgi:hypothetical protein